MRGSMVNRTLTLATTVLATWCLVAEASAQDAKNDATPAMVEASIDARTADPDLPVDHLEVLLRPLNQQELEAELGAWLELLRNQIAEVGKTELAIKNLAEGESSEQLTAELVDQRTTEKALVDRVTVVIESLKAKGGDVAAHEQFITAISQIDETADATTRWAMIVASLRNWITADDGGKWWLKRLFYAGLILLIFWIISKYAGRACAKAISRHPKTSSLLENFARRTAGGLVLLIGVLVAVSALGVEVGPMMAALGAGGFIVGFAMQETLGSFASGLMIMVYRPFDVDDYVCVAGVEGTVQEMSLVSTTLLTIDNKVLVIPNKKAWGDTIINFTGKDIRRVDLVFGIGYEDDIQHATDVLYEIAREHKLVLDEPAVNVQVDELADSSVNLFCRPWTKTTDYWTVHWDLTRQVKERFDAEGISIPYPQRDVHMQPVAVPSSTE